MPPVTLYSSVCSSFVWSNLHALIRSSNINVQCSCMPRGDTTSACTYLWHGVEWLRSWEAWGNTDAVHFRPPGHSLLLWYTLIPKHSQNDFCSHLLWNITVRVRYICSLHVHSTRDSVGRPVLGMQQWKCFCMWFPSDEGMSACIMC